MVEGIFTVRFDNNHSLYSCGPCVATLYSYAAGMSNPMVSDD